MSFTAGCRLVAIPDAGNPGAFPCLLLYPALAPEREERVERFTMPVAMDAPVAGGAFPIVVVSHGTGGSHLLYRPLALHLARAGFVVLCPEHPRNNRNDDTLAGTRELLEARPRHVRATIDWACADAALAPHLLADRVAVVGHSLGGYTALALAGGHAWSGPQETPGGQPQPLPPARDARVRAIVLLAPATPWFQAPGALADVRVPVLMYTGTRDQATTSWHGDIVRRGLPSRALLDDRSVEGAGHYSFLAPFPAHLVSPSFPPSQDPPGFDRERFHQRLAIEVEAFLARVLG